jgi:tetratricopeptide (TPR) repeat protein
VIRTVAALALLVAAAAADQQLALEFADGTTKTMTVSVCDDLGVFIGSGAQRSRIAWARLTPACALRVRAALTPPMDVEARRELAEFARRLKLYPEAIEAWQIVLALGGIDAAGFRTHQEELAAEEQEYLCSRIDALLASGEEPVMCLAAIRSLAARYPDHPANAKYEPRIAKLEEAVAAAGPGPDALALASLREEIRKLTAEKAEHLEKADALRRQAVPAIEKEQLSRIRKLLLEPKGAELHYKRARGCLRSMARADKRFQVTVRDELQKEFDRIGRELIDCYLTVARPLLRQRNYKGTVEYVRQVLLLDPIHEEALKMVEEIRKNRIHFESSGIGAAPTPPTVDGE